MKKSTFYEILKSQNKPDKDENLKKLIFDLFNYNKGLYGYRRITFALRNKGTMINHKKVQKLMKSLNLFGKTLRRKNKYSSFKGDAHKNIPNLLLDKENITEDFFRYKRIFSSDKYLKILGTDVTEFKLKNEEKAYFSPVVDFENREILGYSISKSPNLRMIGKMLKNVEENGHSLNNVLLHSDQGWQYTHEEYINYLKKKQTIQSMSRKGNCLDNSPTECLFSVIKREFWFEEENRFKSFKEFKTALEKYISYYNNDRIVNKLKGLSPVQYRNKSKHN